MILTSKDKEFLREIGYYEKDFSRIEIATEFTDYFYRRKRIELEKAIEILGRNDFLSGVARSAFHVTASRDTKDGSQVFFCSLRLIKANDSK